MKRDNKFIYPRTVREAIEGKRHYNINDKEKLPSVTTILSATEPAEKKEGLKRWREKMGEANAAAHNMAVRVIEQGLCNVPTYYGTECTLYYPGLYAGQTDLVGIHKGTDAIIDFKQTNKPKRREWIGDYCLQLAAYAMAHNFIYKTEITKGVVMMCSKDNYYQEFVIEGKEFQKYKHDFLRRVDEYYKQRSSNVG
jgi:genome maintenance exonuclease 1